MNAKQIEQKIIQLNDECDLTALIQQFCTMYYNNMDREFRGDLTLVMYNRSEAHTVEDIMGDRMDMCLNGWVPNKNRKQTRYDFIIALPPLFDIFELNNTLADVKDYTHILPMVISLNSITNQVEVGIDMSIVFKLHQFPNPILN
jgi:hypothetical protein